MRCVASIQAQSVFYMPNPIAARLGVKSAFTAEEIDVIADHITEFSLAGIRAASAAQRRHSDSERRHSIPVRAPVRSTAGRRR
jgi:hypothetical protein